MMIALQDRPEVVVGSILEVTVEEITIPEPIILEDTRTLDVVRAMLLGQVLAGSGQAWPPVG
jgi:hypothetical protein